MRGYSHNVVRCLRVFLLILVLCTIYDGQAKAASGTAAQLTIASDECVVDVVNNGNSQTLQASSASCNVVLPNLLTILPGSPIRQTLPFAGLATSGQVVVQPSMGNRLPWEPLTSETKSGAISQPAMRMVVMVTGVSATLIATVIGIDIALFELRVTRFFMRVASERNPVRLIRKR